MDTPTRTLDRPSYRIISAYVRFRCVRCGKRIHLEAAPADVEELCRLRGWNNTERGWICRNCTWRPDAASRHALVATHGAGLLLKLWQELGDWKPEVFNEVMGVSLQRLYQLRKALIRRGFVDPRSPKKLIAKPSKEPDETERNPIPDVWKL